jgi:pilus assembly protein Flp/PilA
MTFFSKMIRDESGATAIEYGLIAALIAVAAIAAMTFLGQSLTDIFNGVGNEIQTSVTDNGLDTTPTGN